MTSDATLKRAKDMGAEKGECPYRGLAPFSEEYSEYFFGRRTDARQIAARLIAGRLLVLFGPSGVGKSSIVGAALPRALDSIIHDTLIVPFSHWGEGFCGALLDEAKRRSGLANRGSVKSMEDVSVAWNKEREKPVVFVFDQFEQYFISTLGGGPDKSSMGAFEVDLARTINIPDLDSHVLISIREDALYELEYLRDRLPGILSDPMRLDYLDEEAAKKAIREPLGVFKRYFGADGGPVEIEDALVQELLDKASRAYDPTRFQTPYLQLVLERLWNEERASGSQTLRLATYKTLGGWKGIADRHVSSTLKAVLSDEERSLCARLFDRLVTPSGMKISMSAKDLADTAKPPAGRDEVKRVLEKLGKSDSRIICPVVSAQDPEEPRYEIFHDVLARPILAWKRTFDVQQEQQRLRAEAEEEQKRQQAELAKERRSKKRFRAAAIVALALLAVALAAAAYAARLSHESALQRSRILAQRADFAMKFGDHRVALLLALEALPKKPGWTNWLFKPVTEEAKDVLASAVLRPQGSTLSDHDDPIRSVAFSPEENVILTASEDKTARLWRWTGKAWKEIHALKQDAAVNSANFSPDGTLILTGADNGWAYIWNARSRKKLTEWPVERQGGRTTVDISPDNKRVATVVMSGDAKIWNWDEEQDQRGLYRPPKYFRTLKDEQEDRTHAVGTSFIAFDHTGGRVVTASWRGQVRVWDAETGKRLHELSPAKRDDRGVCEEKSPGHCDAVLFAGFDPANRKLVTASFDKTAIIWDLQSGSVVHKLRHDRGVTYAAFSKDGSRVITAALDGAVRLWDAETGETLQVLQGPATVAGFPASAALSPNEDYVVASFSNNWAHVWKIPEAAALARVRLLSDEAGHSTAGSGSARISVAGLAVDIYDPATSKYAEATEFFKRGPLSVSVAPGGQIAVGSGPCAKIYEIRSGNDGRSLGHVLSLRHEDGQAFRYKNGQVVDSENEKNPCGDDDKFGNNRSAISADNDKSVVLPKALILSTAYDAFGRRVLTTSQDGTAKVWDAATGKLLAGPLRHDGAKQNAVFSGVFSLDGKHVLTGSFDGTVRVWNAEDGSEPPKKIEVGEPILDAAYSDSGQHVVVETLRMQDEPLTSRPFFKTEKAEWDIETTKLVGKLEKDEPKGRLTFRHNLILPPGEDPVRLSLAVKEDLKILPIGFNDIKQVGFSAGGKSLMTLSIDGSVRVWKWPPDDVYKLVAYANQVAGKQLEGDARKLSAVERRFLGLSN